MPRQIKIDQYTDQDIMDYVQIALAAQRSPAHKYLLNGLVIDQEDGHNYIVAVTDAVSGAEGMGVTVDYYLDKNKMLGSTIGQQLTTCLASLGELNALNEEALKAKVGKLLPLADPAQINLVVGILTTAQFKQDAIGAQVVVKNNEAAAKNKDVFDEIMPELMKGREMRAKIVMPYNVLYGKDTTLDANGNFNAVKYDAQTRHWMPAEILIHKHNTGKNKKTNHHYAVTISQCDTFGPALMAEADFNAMKAAILKRILAMDPRAVGRITVTNELSNRPRRQHDNVSCAVITAHEIVARAKGEDLRIQPAYPAGAEELRIAQWNYIRDNPVDNNQRFLARNSQESEAAAMPGFRTSQDEVVGRISAAHLTDKLKYLRQNISNLAQSPEAFARELNQLISHIDKWTDLPAVKAKDGSLHYKDKDGEIVLTPNKAGGFDVTVTGKISGVLTVPRVGSDAPDIIQIIGGHVVQGFIMPEHAQYGKTSINKITANGTEVLNHAKSKEAGARGKSTHVEREEQRRSSGSLSERDV